MTSKRPQVQNNENLIPQYPNRKQRRMIKQAGPSRNRKMTRGHIAFLLKDSTNGILNIPGSCIHKNFAQRN